MMKKDVSPSVIRRLPRYFRYLNDLQQNGVTRISSKELSEKMNLTASQIRQDLNCFGGFGQQGYGYTVSSLLQEIRAILGADGRRSAIIVGMGNMGTALAQNMKFEKRGVYLSGLFDNDAEKIGKKIGNLAITDIAEIESFCKTSLPDIAILTVPKDITKQTIEHLAKLGIKGFWNFASIELEIPGISIETVHFGDSLMLLCYDLKQS